MSVRLLGIVAVALVAAGAQIAAGQEGNAKESAPLPNDKQSAPVQNGLDLQPTAPDALWTATTDGVTLTRHKPNYRGLVDDGAGTVLLDYSNFHFDTALGWDLDLTRHHVLGTAWDLEGVFFNVDSWNTSVGAASDGTGAARLLFATPITLPGVTSISATDKTLLRSAEINARRDMGEFFSVLAGFRYIEFDDNLTGNVSGAVPAQAMVTANNFLAGGQIGGDLHFTIGDRLQLGGIVKAGVYCDRASNSAVATAPGVVLGSNAATTNGAFVGQIEATASYQLNRCWSIRGGYQWMWLDGVGTAGNQLAVSNPLTGTATVDTTGTPYFHGAFIGVEFWR